MLAVDVCALPATGVGTGVFVAALFLLVAGVVVARWVRASAGRLSVVAVAPILMMGFVGAAVSTDPSCEQSFVAPTSTSPPETTTTSVAPTTSSPATTSSTTTTSVPVNNDLVLKINTSLVEMGSVAGQFMTGADSVPNNEGYVFELALSGEVAVRIDWGDGSPIDVVNNVDVVNNAGLISHTYAEQAEYTIRVSGTLTGLGREPCLCPHYGRSYLTSVESFGNLGITSLVYAFYGAHNLTSVPKNLPVGVTNLNGTFYEAINFNGDIGGWDTSNVTNMIGMFQFASSFNGDLSRWNTENVDEMFYMFFGATTFNGDVSGWETGNVTNMNAMFAGASSFDRSLGEWDVTNVTSMSTMLDGAGLTENNYGSTLVGWASQMVQSCVPLGADGLQVSSTDAAGVAARASLISEDSWDITDSTIVPLSSQSEGDGSVAVARC